MSQSSWVATVLVTGLLLTIIARGRVPVYMAILGLGADAPAAQPTTPGSGPGPGGSSGIPGLTVPFEQYVPPAGIPRNWGESPLNPRNWGWPF
jgi:hypothetical protein